MAPFLPDEFTGKTVGKSDFYVELAPAMRKRDLNGPVWVRHGGLQAGQVTEIRRDANLLESRRHGIDSGDCSQQFEIWARAPGMAVGTRVWFTFFSPGSQALSEHFAPRPKHFQVSVAQADFAQGGVGVSPEVNGGLGNRGIAESFLEHWASLSGRQNMCQNSERIHLLRIGLMRWLIGKQA